MDRWAENQLVRFSSFIGKGRYAVDTENGYDEITGAENIFFQDKSFNLASDVKATFDQVTGLDTDSGLFT